MIHHNIKDSSFIKTKLLVIELCRFKVVLNTDLEDSEVIWSSNETKKQEITNEKKRTECNEVHPKINHDIEQENYREQDPR